MEELKTTTEVTTTQSKQSIGGFQVMQYLVKKAKESERVKIVLEADVEEVTAGDFGFGDVLHALWAHQAGEQDVVINLYIEKKK